MYICNSVFTRDSTIRLSHYNVTIERMFVLMVCLTNLLLICLSALVCLSCSVPSILCFVPSVPFRFVPFHFKCNILILYLHFLIHIRFYLRVLSSVLVNDLLMVSFCVRSNMYGKWCVDCTIESGRLFVWGENQFSQIFAGSKEVISKPSCVKEIKNLGYKVRNIAFGEAFSVILTGTLNFYHIKM